MKKKILILGIASLFFSLLFVNTNFYLFIGLFAIFSICFIYSKDVVIEYLKRLKNTEQPIKKELANNQKNMLAREIDEMIIKRKRVNKEVIMLEDKKRNLLTEIQNKEEIEKNKKNDISKLKTQKDILKSEKKKRRI